MKTTGRILFVLFLAAAAVVFFAPKHLARMVAGQLGQKSGYGITVDDVNVGLLKPVVRIKNLKVTNPDGFPHPEMMTVQEIYARYDITSLFNPHTIIHELRLNIPRMVLVATGDGKNNFSALSEFLAHPHGEGAAHETIPENRPSSGGSPGIPAGHGNGSRGFTISRLVIRVKEMEVRHYAAGAADPAVIPVPVNMNRAYENVTNVSDVWHAIATELFLGSDGGLFEDLDQLHKDGGTPEARALIKNLKDLFN